MRHGDIYYVIGGAAIGSEQSADRPAIVVSNDTGNKYAPVVEVVYLTTRKKVGLPTHVFIGSAERPSVALCEQIVTVSKSRLVRRINRVTTEEMRRIDKALLKLRRAGSAGWADAKESVFEEMADVVIMLTQLMMIYDGRKAVQQFIDAKVKRLAGRLAEAAPRAGTNAAQEILQPAT